MTFKYSLKNAAFSILLLGCITKSAHGHPQSAVQAVIDADPALRSAHWGLLVERPSGAVVVQHEPDRVLLPASNLKLLVGACSMALLGPDYRFTTELYWDASAHALYLRGSGDPSLATADLQQAVSTLDVSDVQQVLVDDSAFPTAALGAGWAWDDLSDDYSAESDAVCLDENVAHLQAADGQVHVDPDSGGYLTTIWAPGPDAIDRQWGSNLVVVYGSVNGTVTVHDPGLYAANVLATLVQQRSHHERPRTGRGMVPTGARLLASHASAPLSVLVTHMLKDSDNLYAEQLLHTLGGGRTDVGLAVEERWLGWTDPHRIVDGSGLSRYDLVSPAELVSLLLRAYPGDAANYLPVAGVDGTLRHRLQGTALQGQVKAKTGSLSGVSSLSGFLRTADGQTLVFSWMCNGYLGPPGGAKKLEDRLLQALYQGAGGGGTAGSTSRQVRKPDSELDASGH